MLYQYWEDNIRPRIAQIFGVETNKIVHPLFGDVRNLRNAIIHNRGIATDDVEKNELLRWYKRGDIINLGKQRYCEVSQAILKAMLDHEVIPDGNDDLVYALRQHLI